MLGDFRDPNPSECGYRPARHLPPHVFLPALPHDLDSDGDQGDIHEGQDYPVSGRPPVSSELGSAGHEEQDPDHEDAD